MKTRVLYLVLCIGIVGCVMLKKECPQKEIHRSCSFYDEYTCWEKSDHLERVKTSPKRLVHCKSGCFCKKGFVRAHPEGLCIPAMTCRNIKLQVVISRLPVDFTGLL